MMKAKQAEFAGAPRCPGGVLTRRDFLKYAAASAAALPALTRLPGVAADASAGGKVPRAVTSIGLCKRYEFTEVKRCLARLFDELGDVKRLVKRKHVTVKTNLVNTS